MIREFTIRHLESFTAVAEQGSFTQAGRVLHLSQPTISSHIKALEDLLDVDLVIRSGPGAGSLTPEGGELYPMARRILEDCTALNNAVDGMKSGNLDMPLFLGSTMLPGQFILPEILAEFLAGHSKTHYVLSQGNSEELHQMLDAGKIRIAFAGYKKNTGFYSYTPILNDEFVMVTPNNEHYRKCKENGFLGQDLLGDPTVARDEVSGTDRTVRKLMGRIGFLPENLNIVARASDPETLKKMVIKGMGVSVLSARAVANEVKSGHVLTFKMCDPPLYRTFYMITKSDVKLTPIEEEFMELVKTTCREV